MDKSILLEKLKNSGNNNHFSIEIHQSNDISELNIVESAKELEGDGSITLSELKKYEYGVYLSGKIL